MTPKPRSETNLLTLPCGTSDLQRKNLRHTETCYRANRSPERQKTDVATKLKRGLTEKFDHAEREEQPEGVQTCIFVAHYTRRSVRGKGKDARGCPTSRTSPVFNTSRHLDKPGRSIRDPDILVLEDLRLGYIRLREGRVRLKDLSSTWRAFLAALRSDQHYRRFAAQALGSSSFRMRLRLAYRAGWARTFRRTVTIRPRPVPT